MCMGFGCNAAGIVSTRIIDSKRDRLLAILTNNFVPCNGRFPSLIVLSVIFISGLSIQSTSFFSAALVVVAVVSSVFVTLLVTRILSGTLLKGNGASLVLELPQYRRPQFTRVIVKSFFDRTVFVLARAVVVAAPAGLCVWILQNIHIGGYSLLYQISNFLDPFGRILGMDGVILTAFIIGMPANEIVIPIMIMCYAGESGLMELNSINALSNLFLQNGWTSLTAICTMIFSLNHFPCSTTLLTIASETKSIKWTFVAFALPTMVGMLICFVIAGLFG